MPVVKYYSLMQIKNKEFRVLTAPIEAEIDEFIELNFADSILSYLYVLEKNLLIENGWKAITTFCNINETYYQTNIAIYGILQLFEYSNGKHNFLSAHI